MHIGQDQVFGGVSVNCWYATSVADAHIWWDIAFSKSVSPVIMSQTGIMFHRYRMSPVSTSRTNTSPKRDRTRKMGIFFDDENAFYVSTVLKDSRAAEIKQNRESIEGYSRWKVEKRHGKLGKTGLNNWSISKSPKGRMEPGVRKGKRSLLAYHNM